MKRNKISLPLQDLKEASRIISLDKDAECVYFLKNKEYDKLQQSIASVLSEISSRRESIRKKQDTLTQKFNSNLKEQDIVASVKDLIPIKNSDEINKIKAEIESLRLQSGNQDLKSWIQAISAIFCPV